jgi:ABC-type phosphate/phosphonate transport system substrate-binding protein
MRAVRVHSFLGARALPHYAAVGSIVARACGLDARPCTEPGLGNLDAVLDAPGPGLLFLCGLPYVRARDAGRPVEPIAAPVPHGEHAPRYVASLVTRPGLQATSADDLVGMRIGFNGEDSLSGYVLPVSALAARTPPPPLYDGAIRTGSHASSLRMLASGELDAAAIDSTVLALEAQADPAIAALPVVDRFGPAPIPPVVLLHGTPALADALRGALLSLGASDEGRAALELGLVDGYVAVTDAGYDPVRAMDAAVRYP